MKFTLKKLVLFTSILTMLILATTVSSFAAEAKLAQVKASSLRFRSSPSLNGNEIGRISNGATILIIDTVENGEWYKVVHNYQTGFVSAEYVTIKPDADIELGDGISVGSSVNVRGEPSTSASVLGQMEKGQRVSLTGVSNGWFKISFNGETGFVHADYLSVEKTAQVMAPQPAAVSAMPEDEVEPELMDGDGDFGEPDEGGAADAEAVEASASNISSIQVEIVEFAKSFLGKKYKYGTAGPNTFDCSGFTTYVFKKFGYSLNRSAAGQLSNGRSIPKSELQIGDLVLFRDTSINKAAASHAGMYIGNNQFIHASSRRGGVIITSLSENYYSKHFVGARRIL